MVWEWGCSGNVPWVWKFVGDGERANGREGERKTVRGFARVRTGLGVSS